MHFTISSVCINLNSIHISLLVQFVLPYANPVFFFYYQVPILDQSNLRWIKHNTLVRFRGMIQDMFGNELYVGAFKVWLVFPLILRG